MTLSMPYKLIRKPSHHSSRNNHNGPLSKQRYGVGSSATNGYQTIQRLAGQYCNLAGDNRPRVSPDQESTYPHPWRFHAERLHGRGLEEIAILQLFRSCTPVAVELLRGAGF